MSCETTPSNIIGIKLEHSKTRRGGEMKRKIFEEKNGSKNSKFGEKETYLRRSINNKHKKHEENIS